MNSGTLVKKYIEECTVNEIVDLNKLINKLDIHQTVIPSKSLGMTEKGRLLRRDDKTVIGFNPNCTEREKNTLRAVLLAHGMLYPEKLSGVGISIDTFYLQEIRRSRTSKDVLLATYIAIPEGVRDQVGDLKFNCNAYADKANLMSPFVSSSTSDSTVAFIINKCFGVLFGFELKKPTIQEMVSWNCL